MMIFVQSRELARLRATQRFPITSGPEFFDDVFTWIENDPLSALYSIAYSLSVEKLRGNFDAQSDFEARFGIPNSTESERQAISNDLYTVYWSPFTLLHNMLKLLLLTSETSETPNTLIFHLDDLRSVDYRRREMRDGARVFSEAQSELVDAVINACPIGALDQQGKYRRSMDVAREEPDRYKVYHHLIDASELLRRKVECRLRETYSSTKYKITLRLLMFASSADEPNIYYWQGQKSATLWILLHTLACLNAFTDNTYAEQFLALLSNLDFFIECGSCSQNWQRFERPKWLGYAGRTSTNEKNNVNQNPYRADRQNVRSSRVYVPDFEIELARIHNSISKRENKNAELTTCALENLVRDYRRLVVSLVRGEEIEDSTVEVLDNEVDLFKVKNREGIIVMGDVYSEKKTFLQVEKNSIMY